MNDAAAPGLLSLSHVALRATDVERSVAFYRDVLGFEEASRLRHGDGALMLVNMRVSELQWIELFEASRLPPDGDPIHQIAFRITDAEDLRRRLAAGGHAVPEKCPRGQMGNAYLIVRDPNGYDIEFVEYLPDAWPLREPSGHLPATRVSPEIAHAGLVLRQPEESADFYLGELGLTASADGRWILAGGRDCLQTVSAREDAPHFALEVPDLEVALARLRASGVVPEICSGADGRRRAALIDPEGIRVELHETGRRGPAFGPTG